MTRLLMIMATLVMGFGPVPVAIMAAPLDGSVYVCAGTEVRECEAGVECLRATAEAVNLPTLFRVDSTQKLLSALGSDGRTTPIHALERRNGRLVLHGGAAGRW